MKKVVPIAIYKKGIRYKVAEALVEVGDVDIKGLEIDITSPILTEIKKKEN